jgi:hypothetical protein
MKPEKPTWRPLALAVAVNAGILAAVFRIVPHPPNFSGFGGLGLFGGARLRGWQAYVLPLAIMVLSDLALWMLTGFDFKYSLGHLSRVFVYASFMIYVLIGRTLRQTNSVWSITLAATLGGLQFFVLTNFCEWLFQPWQPYYDQIPAPFRYSRDLNGLLTCFAYALPFYGDVPIVDHPFMLFTDFRLSLVWTILGDIIFSVAYFWIYARLEQSGIWAEPAPQAAVPPGAFKVQS